MKKQINKSGSNFSGRTQKKLTIINDYFGS